MLSILIPTFNECRNIVACIESARWADEVVVVDSGSTDGTPEMARELGARIVDFRWNKQLPKKKNWALHNVEWRNDWVLILDADERLTPELSREIQHVLPRADADGYFISRQFMFMGKWLRHSGYWPSWNLRLFRHRCGRYEDLHPGDTRSGDNEVHEHVVLNGNIGYLNQALLHFAYPDLFTWLEKHNRYSNWEAEVETAGEFNEAGEIGAKLQRRRRLRNLSRRMPFRPTLRFLYSYVLKHGFLDGYQGYVFCRLLAFYELMSLFKARELREERSRKALRE